MVIFVSLVMLLLALHVMIMHYHAEAHFASMGALLSQTSDRVLHDIYDWYELHPNDDDLELHRLIQTRWAAYNVVFNTRSWKVFV